jgi:hypothetical protein
MGMAPWGGVLLVIFVAVAAANGRAPPCGAAEFGSECTGVITIGQFVSQKMPEEAGD